MCVTSGWNVRLPGKGNAWWVGVCWCQRGSGSRIRKERLEGQLAGIRSCVVCGVFAFGDWVEEVFRFCVREMHETLSTKERANGLPLSAAVALTAWAIVAADRRRKAGGPFRVHHNCIICMNAVIYICNVMYIVPRLRKRGRKAE